MLRVIFVHGRSQQGKTPQSLGAEWLESLQAGLNGIGRRLEVQPIVPFYGDLLHEAAERSHWRNAPAPEGSAHPDVLTRGDGFEAFLNEIAQEAMDRGAAELDSETAAETGGGNHPDLLPRSARTGDLSDRGLQNNPILRLFVQGIDAVSPATSELTIRAVLRDVYVYITDSEIQRRIDRVLIDGLGGEPALIVSHSLGTIVAYNVLQSLKPRQSAKFKFVTLGSPLGINAIKRRLAATPSIPPAVEAWFNAYDRRDIVSLNSLSAPHFLRSESGAFREHDSVQNGTDNRHGISGYLNDPAVARAIFEFCAV